MKQREYWIRYYLDYLSRIFVSCLLAILPAVAVQFWSTTKLGLFYGGTSLIIMVGVAIDTIQQINSYLLNSHYDGLMKSGTKRKSSL